MMDIKEFEQLIIQQLQLVIEKIISDNLELNISAKARAGAEISDWIEEKFVEYTREHKYFLLLINKLKESHQRQIDISTRELKKLDHLQQALLESNIQSESDIINHLNSLE